MIPIGHLSIVPHTSCFGTLYCFMMDSSFSLVATEAGKWPVSHGKRSESCCCSSIWTMNVNVYISLHESSQSNGIKARHKIPRSQAARFVEAFATKCNIDKCMCWKDCKWRFPSMKIGLHETPQVPFSVPVDDILLGKGVIAQSSSC